MWSGASGESDLATDRSTREERVNEAVASYLDATARGQPPDVAEFLARYPDLTDELRAFLDDRQRFTRAAGAPPAAEAVTLLPDAAFPMPPTGGTVKYFGDYELLEEIARGAMGVVYRARQVSLNRVVALKMILAGQFASAADVVRFRREAESAANFDHPNIVPIYEVGEHEGQEYFAMKLVEGSSLAGKVAELVGHSRQAAELLAKVCRAVHYAHQRGVIHRDLKPGNVLLDREGTPYVSDFGLAKRLEGDSGLTQSGAIVGTPSYMAPEQAGARKDVSTAADVWALGAILYELLTGRAPFAAATTLETVLQVLEKEPADPRSLNRAADRDLSAVALKCLNKKPEDRYESAAALAEDLERWLAGEPTRARPPSLAGLAWRWLRRNATAAATVIVLGVAWGASVGLSPYATAWQDYDSTLAMVARGTGTFNPLGVAYHVYKYPAVRQLVLVTAAGTTLAFGWLLRAGTGAKTFRSALAFAATTGLLATLIGFIFAGPGWVTEPVPGGLAVEDFPQRDMLTPSGITFLQRANQMYAASVGIWSVLLAAATFFIGMSLASTWALDLSGRLAPRWFGRFLAYAELYGSALLLVFGGLLWIIGARSYPVAESRIEFIGPRIKKVTETRVVFTGAPLQRIGLFLATFAAGMLVIGYVTHVRRWSQLVHQVLVAVWVGLLLGAVSWFGWLL